MSQERASGAMRVFSSSGGILSKSSFCHIHVKEPFYCYHRMQRVDVSYQGKISLNLRALQSTLAQQLPYTNPIAKGIPVCMVSQTLQNHKHV